MTVPATVSATPSDVAVVGQDMTLHCLKSGEVEVIASAGPASTRGSFRCRPVARIEAPSEVRLILPNGPTEPKIALLDAEGNEYSDVAPTLAVEDGRIATTSGGNLSPVHVGATNLVVTAGSVRETIPVTVVRKIDSKPLLLNDGARVAYTLQQGRYEIEVKGRASNGSKFGVTAKWVGGAGCDDVAETQELTSSCTIENTGSVIIENPTALGLGPAFDGFVNIYQVP